MNHLRRQFFQKASLRAHPFGLLLFLWLALPSVNGREIAFFYALDADLAALKEGGKPSGAPKVIGGQSVATLQIGPHRVHAVKMGAGCIQTAMAAATVLSRFPCDVAVSIGPAGRLSDQLRVGEWVRVAEVVSYQQGSESKDGFVLGRNATLKLGDELAVAAPKSLATCKPVRLASGELFIASAAFREQLRATTQAAGVDMNLAGLAVACAATGTQLLAWKVVSDSANDSAPADFQAFVKAYQGEGGRRIAEWIKALPPDPNDPSTHSHLKALLNLPE